MSDPIPSSARSALREAALRAIQADAEAELADDAPGEGADGACRVAFADFHNACEPDTILALLSLAERGAEDAKRLAWFARNPNAVVWGAGFLHARGHWCYRDAAHNHHPADSLADAIDKAMLASSPTGGTTE